MTDVSPQRLAGGDPDASAATEGKVTRRLESLIKSKLANSGLDTGGRQIEVKLVTSTFTPGAGATGESGSGVIYSFFFILIIPFGTVEKSDNKIL